MDHQSRPGLWPISLFLAVNTRILSALTTIRYSLLDTLRMGTATGLARTTLLLIQKKELLHALHDQHELSDLFIACMLSRNIRIEEDLIDQLFNSSERRLARTLLLLARYGMQEQPNGIVPLVSQETLAGMVGTTRSRVNFFMNKFRKLGFIEYQ